MPNHIKEVISKLLREHEGKKIVDFERIIPMPKFISREGIPSHVKTAAEIALGLVDLKQAPEVVDRAEAFAAGQFGVLSDDPHRQNCIRQMIEGPFPKDFSDEDFETFVNYVRAYRECGGLMDWYDWSVEMWGTKWNAYDAVIVSETEVFFETAWSAPHPVIERLVEQTKSELLHEWADEDTGNNVGRREYQADSQFQENEMSGTKDGYELAFKLDPEIAERYEFDGESYQHKDEDSEDE